MLRVQLGFGVNQFESGGQLPCQTRVIWITVRFAVKRHSLVTVEKA